MDKVNLPNNRLFFEPSGTWVKVKSAVYSKINGEIKFSIPVVGPLKITLFSIPVILKDISKFTKKIRPIGHIYVSHLIKKSKKNED